ncbi:hypothetical protein BCY86_07185 [Pajaroellobacter abortibovis]|uniref:Uncharacterized protein n=1 Tax=Pajaroellobacter abortibovis TaxID=1882918 RepID=A0A1L6MY99_9BACT|nr:hypothetical protein BCY86_07185 [Pajaroellobacter abortibovis]
MQQAFFNFNIHTKISKGIYLRCSERPRSIVRLSIQEPGGKDSNQGLTYSIEHKSWRKEQLRTHLLNDATWREKKKLFFQITIRTS